MNYTATYTQEGRIIVDGSEIGTYDADGGAWENEVADVLRDKGYTVVSDWDGDTIQVEL